LYLVGILFPRINDDAGQNYIKFDKHILNKCIWWSCHVNCYTSLMHGMEHTESFYIGLGL